MSDLKPCPFCGGEAEHSVGKTGDGRPWHYVECIECGASGPTGAYADHNIDVVRFRASQWNTRTTLAELTSSEAANGEAKGGKDE